MIVHRGGRKLLPEKGEETPLRFLFLLFRGDKTSEGAVVGLRYGRGVFAPGGMRREQLVVEVLQMLELSEAELQLRAADDRT